MNEDRDPESRLSLSGGLLNRSVEPFPFRESRGLLNRSVEPFPFRESRGLLNRSVEPFPFRESRETGNRDRGPESRTGNRDCPFPRGEETVEGRKQLNVIPGDREFVPGWK